jgi:thioredoxin reductase/NAD-dependent dihydropyrimidine dehydrogenase PreA subunit
MSDALYIIYLVPILALIWRYFRRRAQIERQSVEALHESREAGLLEPASLHPVIDPRRCIGCGNCVRACPEQEHHQLLGFIDGHAELVKPTECIGHGACKVVCPVGAITLVFGTERRGIDIPLVSPDFESNVPGIFIAGELGGMGLIRNALEQGRQACESIIAKRPRGKGDQLDLVIVGSGPAGFAASLNALSRKLRFTTIEQESLGGCVFQYPRGKLVMTAPATLPLVGKVRFTNTSKEELLAFWREVEAKNGLKVRYQERVEAITPEGSGGFVVRSTKGEYRAASVLLTIGRRGTPRKLGVPGEELPKVVYRLIDPEQYANKKVLVVGGGDSALEAAASVAELGNASVTLSYRSEAFARAKPRNRKRVDAAEKAGTLRVLLSSTVKQIEAGRVKIAQKEQVHDLENDAVIVNAGGVLPNDFLKSIGIAVETKFGTA